MECNNRTQSKVPLDISTPKCSRRSSMHISRKTSWGTPIPPPASQNGSTGQFHGEVFDDVDLNCNRDSSPISMNGTAWNTLDSITALGLSFDVDDSEARYSNGRERFALEDLESINNQSLPLKSEHPFNKWVKNIQRKAAKRPKTDSCDYIGSGLEENHFDSLAQKRRSRHKKSSSGSSSAFVTAVKSASISLASFSIAPRSRKTGSSSYLHRTDRSSKASNRGRLSEDSAYIARNIIVDQGVTQRLLQRRRVLEEIIATEESYVADVKFLMNAYVTLMAAIPTLSLNLRASINRNLNEIVELHNELLGDLHRTVPYSEYTQACPVDTKLAQSAYGHHRWCGLDAVLEHAGESSWLQRIPGMTAEPKVAASVARVFEKKINRFFIYEEYGAKYELMIKDIASAYRTMPQWEAYQRGIEALASSLSSVNLNAQIGNSRKALTVGDLLVKPIQRVCKYPLLFAELLKQTPVCDCPDSHMVIDDVLIRLREVTAEINRATDDPRMKATMEKSWLLQDRILFPNKSEARSKSIARSLGHIQLCGVLHVSWQTKAGVDGQYLVTLLYRDFLVLSSVAKADQVYTVQACIGLNELRVEEIDNGRGLQCHTAPFSWKIVFEYDHQLFELTMSACSFKEELEWRSRLTNCFSRDGLAIRERAPCSSLSLDIRPMGAVFGKPGTIARRISIHRATTVGSMSGLCQVIIKNTNACRSILHSTSSASINRSQSLLTTNRIPVLAPSRAERIRIETLLSDVWSRDVLPFPGINGRARNEHLVRASASSMIRKLSVASIASNFTKRSGSMASLQKAAEDELLIDIEALTTNSTEHGSSEAAVPPDADDMSRTRLSVIQDEKENAQNGSMESIASNTFEPDDSPVGSMHRFASKKMKGSWGADGQRIITPPLRTSSANSLNQNRVTQLSIGAEVPSEAKENVPQAQPASKPEKNEKRGRGLGKNRVAVEGIRSFFR